MASYAAINSQSSEHAPSRPASAEPSRRRHRKENGVAGNASWISSVINLVNTIVGAGVLAMPHAVIFDTAIAIKCFGVGISYLIIIGDLMPGVVQGFGNPGNATYLVDRHFWVTAFM